MQTSTEALRPFAEAGNNPADEGTPEIDLIDTDEACAIVGGRNKPVHRSTLWRLIKAGKLPAPNKKLRRWNRRPFVEAVCAILEDEAA